MADHPVTRMVHIMSKAHRTKESVRKGDMNIRDVARRTIFSPTHFPTFLAATMTVSGLVGYYYMASVHYRYIQRQENIHQIALEQTQQPVSRNQAAIHAMTRDSTRSFIGSSDENRYALNAQSRFTRRITIKPQQIARRLTVGTNEFLKMGTLDPHSS